NNHARRLVIQGTQVQGQHAVVAEIGIGRAVGIQADHAHVHIADHVGHARDHDLVAGDGNRMGYVIAPDKIDEYFAAIAEAAVELASGGIPGNQIIAAAIAGGENVAVAVHGQGANRLVIHPQIAYDHAVGAEIGVERSVAVVAGHRHVG